MIQKKKQTIVSKHSKIFHNVVNFGLGLLILCFTLGVLVGCQDQSASADNSSSTSDQSATENTTASTGTEISQEEMIQSLEIPAGLSDEELAKETMDRLSAWLIAGYRTDYEKSVLKDNYTDYNWDNNTFDPTDYATKIASDNVSTFAEALFIDDYQNSSTADNLTSFINKYESLNETCIHNILMTAWDDNDPDNVTYNAFYQYESVEKQPNSGENKRTIVISANQIISGSGDSGMDGSTPLTFTVSFLEQNGVEKIYFATVE